MQYPRVCCSSAPVTDFHLEPEIASSLHNLVKSARFPLGKSAFSNSRRNMSYDDFLSALAQESPIRVPNKGSCNPAHITSLGLLTYFISAACHVCGCFSVYFGTTPSLPSCLANASQRQDECTGLFCDIGNIIK